MVDRPGPAVVVWDGVPAQLVKVVAAGPVFSLPTRISDRPALLDLVTAPGAVVEGFVLVSDPLNTHDEAR
jgi:hypothetical protein